MLSHLRRYQRSQRQRQQHRRLLFLWSYPLSSLPSVIPISRLFLILLLLSCNNFIGIGVSGIISLSSSTSSTKSSSFSLLLKQQRQQQHQQCYRRYSKASITTSTTTKIMTSTTSLKESEGSTSNGRSQPTYTIIYALDFDGVLVDSANEVSKRFFVFEYLILFHLSHAKKKCLSFSSFFLVHFIHSFHSSLHTFLISLIHIIVVGFIWYGFLKTFISKSQFFMGR